MPAVMQYLNELNLDFVDTWDIESNTSAIYIGTTSDPRKYDELINHANHLEIKSYAYLDSWVNYSLRINAKPSEILVSDTWANELAKQSFPDLRVSYFENKHAQFIKENYAPKRPDKILYIDSPENSYNGHEKQIHNINCICVQIPKISKVFKREVIYRKHPGYKANQCVTNLADIPTVKSIEEPRSLLRDLEMAQFLVGPISYLHYLAEGIGIPAFTTNRPSGNWHGPKFRSVNL